MRRNFQNKNTSWQKVAPWYNKLTNRGQGHYYHEHVVIPGVLRLLDLNSKFLILNSKLLDLACGNGVLAKSLPKDVEYLGIDLSESLIKMARNEDKNDKHKYLVADITKPLNIPNGFIQAPHGGAGFTHAAIILALQNVSDPKAVLQNASKLLIDNCKLVIVLNHPAFRIPRQSSWGIDEGKKLEYRRIDKYMSPMEIPINMNPSDRNSEMTMSYHFPISDYTRMLNEAGFAIDLIEEWTSDKESEGRAARMENRSRNEFPLFMALRCFKK